MGAFSFFAFSVCEQYHTVECSGTQRTLATALGNRDGRFAATVASLIVKNSLRGQEARGPINMREPASNRKDYWRMLKADSWRADISG